MKMKKWLAMLLAAMMMFSVAGCGGDDEDYTDDPVDTEYSTDNGDTPDVRNDDETLTDADFVGDWECIGYDVDGQEMTEDEMGESYMTLYDNYEADVTLMDIAYDGEWDFTESGIVLYLDDNGYEEEVYCDIVKNVLYMDYMDMYTIFAKAD